MTIKFAPAMRNPESGNMINRTLGLVAAIAIANPACAQSKLSTSLGVDYSSGDYGTTSTTTVVSIPMGIRYETDNLLLKASLPWLRVTAPTGTSLGPDGRPSSGSTGVRRTESGAGDLVTSVTWMAYNKAGIAIDFTGKVKWGTADAGKGLGTEKNDVSAQVDIYKSLGDTAIFTTLGYKMYGDPTGINFRNVPYVGLGFSHKASSLGALGLTWDYRPKVVDTGKHTSEITGFLTHKLSDSTKAQLYLIKGLSDGSPDWGGGLSLSHAY